MARKGLSRSASTGRYVKASTARRHPSKTVTESRGRSGGGKGKAYRSAATGRYVTEATVKRHPDTTVTER